MNKRVVVTGLGVVAPNGVGISAFTDALLSGRSGVKFNQQLADLNFSCRISAKPLLSEDFVSNYFSALELKGFNSSGILYGVIAGIDAWTDAKLSFNAMPDWGSGCIFGAGTSGIEKFRESIYKIDNFETRKLGSTAVAQTMNSGVSAYLNAKIGFGNQVSTNSSACTTGTESILVAFERIKSGKAKIMLAGSTGDSGPYIWGGFDAMRVCTYKHNDQPEKGSRPMSATASGFVPGSGAGAMVLEDLDSALERGARIYAEIKGGNINSGGQRAEGSMTAPNSVAVQKCISDALSDAEMNAGEIDLVNGHLTATVKDPLEIANWKAAIEREGAEFPFINSLKGMTGHCLSAAGSIESVASVLQLYHNFVHPNINCEDLHPEIAKFIPSSRIPGEVINTQINAVIKASFGFGDVNACIIFKKFY